MRGSLIVLLLFITGIVAGIAGLNDAISLPAELTEWLLYALVIQIGVSLGANGKTGEIIRQINRRTLLLPVLTVTGTLAATFAVALIWREWGISDYLAIGSGLGYYSLSSVIIVDIKKTAIGLDAATQLGALAVMANIIREMIALTCGPLLAKHFGAYTAISAAGVTSMDVTLPMIIRVGGRKLAPIAMIHGLVLEFSVPLLVTLFAGL